MPDVDVTQNTIAVIVVVVLIGVVVVIALLFSFFGARLPKPPGMPSGPNQPPTGPAIPEGRQEPTAAWSVAASDQEMKPA